MKIIFDNVEEMNQTIADYCPRDISQDAFESIHCSSTVGGNTCEMCWKNCGIELEVKDEQSR